MNPLTFFLYANARQFNTTLATAAITATAVASKIVSEMKTIATHTIQVAADYERAQIAFETLAGPPPGKGTALLNQLTELAIRTPFVTKDLTDAAQTMLGMGVAFDSVLPSVERLGDIAAGDSQKLQRLTLAFSQVVAAGRFMGTELRQFTEAGVGAGDFAKALNMRTDEFRQKMHDGAITVSDMIKGINALTNSGGRFYQMNEKQNKTVLGQWNALKETVDFILRKTGVELFEKYDVAGKLGKVTNFLQQNLGGYIKDVMSYLEDVGKKLYEIGQSVFGEVDVKATALAFIDLIKTGVETAMDELRNIAPIAKRVAENAGDVMDAGSSFGNFRRANAGLVATGAGWFVKQFSSDLGREIQEAGEKGFQGAVDRQLEINRRRAASQGVHIWGIKDSPILEGYHDYGKDKDEIPIEYNYSKSLQTAADKIVKAMETGAEAFKGFDHIRDLVEASRDLYDDQGFRQKRALLSQDQLRYGLTKEFLAMEKSLAKQSQVNLPRAQYYGTSEALDAIHEAQYNQPKDHEQRVEALLEASRKANEQETEEVKKIAPILERIYKKPTIRGKGIS